MCSSREFGLVAARTVLLEHSLMASLCCRQEEVTVALHSLALAPGPGSSGSSPILRDRLPGWQGLAQAQVPVKPSPLPCPVPTPPPALGRCPFLQGSASFPLTPTGPVGMGNLLNVPPTPAHPNPPHRLFLDIEESLLSLLSVEETLLPWAPPQAAPLQPSCAENLEVCSLSGAVSTLITDCRLVGGRAGRKGSPQGTPSGTLEDPPGPLTP